MLLNDARVSLLHREAYSATLKGLLEHLLLAHESRQRFLALITQNMQSTLNRGDDALYTALLTSTILATQTPENYRSQRERYDYLVVNSAYAQVVAYRNLRLARKALDIAIQLEGMISAGFTQPAHFWLPHILRHQLVSLAMLPRFALYQVENLAFRTKQIIEAQPHLYGGYHSIVIDRSLMDAYIAYDTPRSRSKARRLAREIEARSPQAGLVGLPRAVVLASLAHAYHTFGDNDAWMWYLQETLHVSVRGNFTHQLSKLRQRYGDVVDQLISKAQSQFR